MSILFLHGLDSSKDSNKYHALDYPQKYCMTIDYRNLSFHSVEALYQQMIRCFKPSLLVGHSLGGYWALRLSAHFGIPAVVANPSITPSFRQDYPSLSIDELDTTVPRRAYIELADERVDMYAVHDVLDVYFPVHVETQGRHQLDHPERLNSLIHELIA